MFSTSHVASRKKSSIFLVCEALVNLVSEKHYFSSWLNRELATLLIFNLLLQMDVSLLYATKIWTWTDTPSNEPYTGTDLLGREIYWNQAFKDFENLAKVIRVESGKCLNFDK